MHTRMPPKKGCSLALGAARLNVTFHRPSFVMACSLCGVRGLDIPCSAHIGTGSQTYENQRSKQVTVASSMSPYERFDRLYPIPDHIEQTLENKLLDAICNGISRTEIIEISIKSPM
jgi:hypothetical protein